MNIRSLICTIATACLVSTGLAAATPPSSAVSGSLFYTCSWTGASPGTGTASAVIDTDSPATMQVGQSVPLTVTATVTLPTELSDWIRATSASYDGTGVADGFVNGTSRQASLTIPRTTVPIAPLGTPINVVGSGPAGTLGSAVPMTLELTAGNFTAHVQGYDSNGDVIALAVVDVTCILHSGQNVHIDTVTVVPVPTTTTLTVQNTPVQYGDQAGVTADVAQTGSNAKPDGTVEFSIDGKSVKGDVKGGKAKATLPSSLTMGVRTVTAVFAPTDKKLATSQAVKTFQVVKADSIPSTSAVYRPAIDKIVAKTKVTSAYETPVDGVVKYLLKRDGVKIRTKKVDVNKFDVARGVFKNIRKSATYTVVARYKGSDTLKRSTDRFKFQI